MNNVNQNNINIGVSISNNEVYINGQKIPPLPNQSKFTINNNTTIINNHVFVNGYEFKNGEWKRTLRALWHLIF